MTRFMHLSATTPGGDPGDIRGHGAGFINFVANFKPVMGGLDFFCTFVVGSPGERPAELFSVAAVLEFELKRRPFFPAVPVYERTGYIGIFPRPSLSSTIKENLSELTIFPLHTSRI